MTVFDHAGRTVHFSADHVSLTLGDGRLEIRTQQGELVATWAHGGWMGLVEDGACQEVQQ